MKIKIQAKRRNHQLNDKKNISLDGTIMSNCEEQHCCNILRMEFHQWDEFILDIIYVVLEMQSLRKSFNFHEQVVI